MSYFDDFLEEELARIISLPARIGIWVALADNVRVTDKDERRESRALEAVLKLLSKNKKSPFVADVAGQTLTYRHQWGDWSKGGEDLLMADIVTATRMIDDRLPAGTGRAFRSMLWRVARVVAMAYGEIKGPGDNLGHDMLLGGLIETLMDGLEDVMPDDPQNLSEAEDRALQKLKAALKA